MFTSCPKELLYYCLGCRDGHLRTLVSLMKPKEHTHTHTQLFLLQTVLFLSLSPQTHTHAHDNLDEQGITPPN